MSEDFKQLIIKNGAESCRVKKLTFETLAADIARTAALCADSIGNGGKVLVCGNGGSAADAQHFAAELVGRFLLDRRPYPAIALTTDSSIMTSLANDFGFDSIFERQVAALGTNKDVLIAISTSGNSPNVLRAIDAAKAAGMKVVSLTGEGGGKMASLSDVLLAVPSKHTPRVQESHAFIVHMLCEIIELTLQASP